MSHLTATLYLFYLFYVTDVTFNETCSILQNAGVEYTILKYGDMRPVAEAKYPYRVMRGVMAIPTEGQGLSNGDLWRIIAELVDLPKSFNNVYSVGSGRHTLIVGILARSFSTHLPPPPFPSTSSSIPHHLLTISLITMIRYHVGCGDLSIHEVTRMA